MRALAPLAALFLLAACSAGPLSVIPPAEIALLSTDVDPVAPPVAVDAAPTDGEDPFAQSFRQTLCAEAAAAGAVLPSCTAPDLAAGLPVPDLSAAAAPVAAPAAISVDAMLARVRNDKASDE